MRVRRSQPRPETSRHRWWCAACLVVLGLVGISTPIHALDPQRPLSQALLRIWQAPQGLPRVVIFSIQQTNDGYLWLGTQGGLFRFDGVRFVPILAQDESLAQRWIQDLAEDQEHNLWIATQDAGLIRWRNGVATSFGLAEGLLSDNVRCLQLDRRGDLWIGTDRGLACIRNGSLVADGDKNFPAEPVHALCEAPDGNIWIATAGPGVWNWDGTNCVKQSFSALPSLATIHAIHAGPEDVVWLATSAGLLRRSGGQERLFTIADGLGSDEVLCLATARDSGLWAGTKDGLCRVQGDRLESFQSRDGLSQSTVLALCEDHEGSLWVGTKYGLNQFVDRRTLLPFTTSEGLPSNDTGPVLQTESGNIWVGTLDAGLAEFAGREFSQAATIENGLPSQRVLSLADGGEDELWIGTDEGLCRRQNGEIVERFTTADGLPANRILALCRDDAGTLWIGASGGIVALREGKLTKPAGTEIEKPVQALINTPRHGLIAAVAGGELYRIAENQVSLFQQELSSWRDVVAFHVDSEKRLWVAFRDGGLGVIDGEQHYRFGVKDGLYDDDIFGFATDDKGRLWVACSRGIFSVAVDELQKFSQGKLRQLNCTPFSPTDALRTIECRRGVQPAVWKMQDGRIWFSTIRGILVVDPQRSSRTLPPPSVLIEEINVNGQSISPQQLTSLPPGRTNFDFHYTALSFASPTRITFRYQLAGFDADWINAGSRREAFYTNLTPGQYRFRVRALNSDGVETESAPLEFTLRPHFYQTWPFYFCIALGLVGAAWAAYRVRVEQIKGRLQVVLAERNRIARELHDTLIQGFSGVTMQLQALAARLKKPEELATLIEIIRDAGGCLSEARRSVAGLRNPENAESGLTAAIAQSARQLTEGSDLRLHLRLDPIASPLNPDVEYNVLRIVQEAISNALKHAQASSVEVQLNSQPDQITISIHDDGLGFDAPKHLEQAQPGHYGLIGMRERASQISATLHWRSQPRQGTTVTLCLPLVAAGVNKR